MGRTDAPTPPNPDRQATRRDSVLCQPDQGKSAEELDKQWSAPPPNPDQPWSGPEPEPPPCLECGGPLDAETLAEGWAICDGCFERMEAEAGGSGDG